MTFLINEMKKKYSILPVLVCESCFYMTSDYEVINLSPPIESRGIKETITNFYNKNEKKFIRQLLKFFIHYRKLGLIDSKSKKILKEVKPDAIVVYSDRMAGILQGFLKNAEGIPLIEVPIAFGDDPLELFKGRYYNEELRVTNKFWDINRLILTLNENWGYAYEGERRLFYAAGYTMAAYMKKMISMYPWIAGGGNTTHVFTVSETSKERILAVTDKKVVVTGLIEDYYLLEKCVDKDKIKKKVREKYNVTSEKIVMFAVPQMAEHNLVPWDIHRENMTIVVNEIIKVYGEVLISLHPKSCVNDYLFLKQCGKVFFMEERLRDVVVGADVLMMLSASSIVRWGDIIGISSVVFQEAWLMKEIDKSVEKEIARRIRECADKGEMISLPLLTVKDVAKEIFMIVN